MISAVLALSTNPPKGKALTAPENAGAHPLPQALVPPPKDKKGGKKEVDLAPRFKPIQGQPEPPQILKALGDDPQIDPFDRKKGTDGRGVTYSHLTSKEQDPVYFIELVNEVTRHRLYTNVRLQNSKGYLLLNRTLLGDVPRGKEYCIQTVEYDASEPKYWQSRKFIL